MTRFDALRLTFCFCLGLSLFGCSSDPRNQPPAVPASTPGSAVNVATLEGYHDISNCNGIMGWAWDQENPDASLKIDIYEGDKLLASVIASDFRQDLLSAKKGNGKHGFTWVVPPSLKDGKPHQIKLKFADADKMLVNTPREITCAAPAP